MEEFVVLDRLVLLSSAPFGSTAIEIPGSVDDILSGRHQSNFDSVMSVLFPVAAEQSAKDCFAKDMFRPDDYPKACISQATTDA